MIKLKFIIALLFLATAVEGQINVMKKLANNGIGSEKFTFEQLSVALDYDKKALFDNPLNQVVYLNLDGKTFEIPPFGLLEYFPITYDTHQIKSWTKEQQFWDATVALAAPLIENPVKPDLGSHQPSDRTQKGSVYFFNLTKSNYRLEPIVYSHRPIINQKRLVPRDIGKETLFFPLQYDPHYSFIFKAPQNLATKDKLGQKIDIKDNVLWKINRVQDFKAKKTPLDKRGEKPEKRLMLEMSIQNAFADLNNALISNGIAWEQDKINRWKKIAQQINDLSGPIDQLLPKVTVELNNEKAFTRPLVIKAYEGFQQALKTYQKEFSTIKGRLRFAKKEKVTRPLHFRSVYEKNEQFYLLYDGLFLNHKKVGPHFSNKYPRAKAQLFGGHQEEVFFENNVPKYTIKGQLNFETNEVTHLFLANQYQQNNENSLAPLVYRKQQYSKAGRLIMQSEIPNFNPLKNALPTSNFVTHYFDENGNEIKEDRYQKHQQYKEYQFKKGHTISGKFFLFLSKQPWFTAVCLLISFLIAWGYFYKIWPASRSKNSLKIGFSLWSFTSIVFGSYCLFYSERGVLELTTEIGGYLLFSLLLLLFIFRKK